MATALAQIGVGLDTVNRQIRQLVETNYDGLMSHAKRVDDMEGTLAPETKCIVR